MESKIEDRMVDKVSPDTRDPREKRKRNETKRTPDDQKVFRVHRPKLVTST